MKVLIGLIVFLLSSMIAFTQKGADAIVGKWMAEDKNLEVEIFKIGNEYIGKVVWFDDTDDKNRPMNTRLDKKNPDKLLRNRKIIGLEVMHGLAYNTDDAEWQGGRIYDSSSGKNWNAKAWIKNEFLKVRGYWHFEFLGETMRFKKSS